jgi:hypothetical protein
MKKSTDKNSTGLKSFPRAGKPGHVRPQMEAEFFEFGSADPFNKEMNAIDKQTPDYLKPKDAHNQKVIYETQRPMFHLQDLMNPYALEKDPTFLKRIVLMREGLVEPVPLATLPCGQYY